MKPSRKPQPIEMVILSLPILLLVVLAVAFQGGDVKKKIVGKWRQSNGATVEFRVNGDELVALEKGKQDSHLSYRFLNDSHIQITDARLGKVHRFMAKARIQGDTLEFTLPSDSPSGKVTRLVRLKS